MGFLAKSTTGADSSTTAGDGAGNNSKGMDFLLVLFPADNNNKNSKSFESSQHHHHHQIMKRTNSSSLILTKTQSTISICALLVFVTFLLFTLSTFEPNQPHKPNHSNSKSPQNSWISNKFSDNPNRITSQKEKFRSPMALQRMGTLFRRGTRAMSDLIVCRVTDDVSEHELRLFLRILHRSGLTAKSDLVFIFESASPLLRFESVIETENESFMKLVEFYNKNGNFSTSQKSVLGFDLNQFMRSIKKEISEPLWGKKIRLNSNNSDLVGNKSAVARLSYGSVVGFEANELDPENSLSGFIDHVPMGLRQWACYPMLLGRVRRNFKHVMLVDVKNSVLLGDPLARVKIPSPESVYVSMKSEVTNNKHHRKNSDKSTHSVVNTAILMGGNRGIRRLSNAMLYEIVRASTVHKKKNSVTESGILGQLVGNEHLLKNINLMKSTESVTGTSSLAELTATLDPLIMKRGNSNYNSSSLYSMIMKRICSFELDASVYRDC